MSVRGVPVQELLEHQDPAVAYNLIEQTGEQVPLEGPVAEEEKPKRRGRPRKSEVELDPPDESAEE